MGRNNLSLEDHPGFSQIICQDGSILQFDTEQELLDCLNDQGDYFIE
jgi:hypothetical protein